MQFRDITTEKETLYTLKENERCVFFMFNKDGEVTFELSGPHAEAHIFALFVDEDASYKLSINQKHLAKNTLSKATTHSVLGRETSVDCLGLIHIADTAGGSDASQESRALLLSPTAKHSALPSLEILPRDVACHHKATASSLNKESLYYLQSRGLNTETSSRMLIHGFLETIFTQMRELGVSPDEIQEIRKTILKKIMILSYA